MRFDHAVLDVASRSRHDVLTAFRVLADAVQSRRTTASRLQQVLSARDLPGRVLIGELLDDLVSGACSVLEREYLRRVERAHGLPQGRRQKPSRAGGRPCLRDVVYDEQDLVVELDGKPFHDTARARDDDAERDLDARIDEQATTVRLTFGMVVGSPCRTARRLGLLLQQRGWAGTVGTCPDCPERRDSQSPDD